MFSVIIPVYNNDVVLLKKAVDSVLQQTCKDYEIVMVDDGSTAEDTLVYLKSLDGIGPVRYIRHEANKGIAAARNTGVLYSSGEYVTFLDCDDYYESNCLDLFRQKLDRQGYDVVCGGYRTVDSAGGEFTRFAGGKKPLASNDLYAHLSSCAIWNRAYRRDFLIQNDIWFPEGCFAEDLAYLAQVYSKAESYIGFDEPIYNNYQNDKSTSRSKAFKEIPYEKLPFDCFKKVLDINDNLSVAVQGLIYNSAVTMACILTKHVSGRQELLRITKAAAEIIAGVEDYKAVANYWSNETSQGPAMRLIQRYIASTKSVAGLARRMRLVNRTIGFVDRIR